jgi:hypothetical protein
MFPLQWTNRVVVKVQRRGNSAKSLVRITDYSVPRAQTQPLKAKEVRNCLTDEGRPLGVGLQEQAPNHLRRLWPKATVVNAEGKGSDITGSGDRQEEDRKGTTAEVSKVFRRWPKPQLVVTAGPTPTIPAYGRSGIRHERWPELAMRQLNGTWEPEIPMLTEKLQVDDPRGREYGCGVLGADCLVVCAEQRNVQEG